LPARREGLADGVGDDAEDSRRRGPSEDQADEKVVLALEHEREQMPILRPHGDSQKRGVNVDLKEPAVRGDAVKEGIELGVREGRRLNVRIHPACGQVRDDPDAVDVFGNRAEGVDCQNSAGEGPGIERAEHRPSVDVLGDLRLDRGGVRACARVIGRVPRPRWSSKEQVGAVAKLRREIDARVVEDERRDASE
jgi:hypothetical protein